VFPPWLNLRMAWNQGMNFGLFSNNAEVTRWVLIAHGAGDVALGLAVDAARTAGLRARCRRGC
jgi:lipoprotein signal peptidase